MKIKYEYDETFEPDYNLVIFYHKEEYDLFQQIIKGLHLDIADCIDYGYIELLCSVSIDDFKILNERCADFHVLCIEEKEEQHYEM